jgi:hypothetical protein
MGEFNEKPRDGRSVMGPDPESTSARARGIADYHQ